MHAFAYFSPNKDSTTHKCKACDGVLSQVHGSGYSNLEQHTRLVHGKDHDVVVAAHQEAKKKVPSQSSILGCFSRGKWASRRTNSRQVHTRRERRQKSSSK